MRWVIVLSAMVTLAYLSLLAEAIHYVLIAHPRSSRTLVRSTIRPIHCAVAEKSDPAAAINRAGAIIAVRVLSTISPARATTPPPTDDIRRPS